MQNELARAEGYHIAGTDHQYVVPTNGTPPPNPYPNPNPNPYPNPNPNLNPLGEAVRLSGHSRCGDAGGELGLGEMYGRYTGDVWEIYGRYRGAVR